MAYHSKLKVIS